MAKTKVMLTVADSVYDILLTEAKERGCSVQELVRAEIVPEWFRARRIRLVK